MDLAWYNVDGERVLGCDGMADSLALWESQELPKHVKCRLLSYPPISEQLDMIFHKGEAYWKAHIQSIKDKYPKPEGL